MCNLPRTLLGVIDKFLDALPGPLGADDEDRRIRGNQSDGNQLVHGIGGLAVEELVRFGNDRNARQSHQQIVAVRLAVGHERHSHGARRTGLIRHHHRIF
jgi:hypothetical protein